MKKIFLLLAILALSLSAFPQVNKKFGKVTATKAVVTPVLKAYADTIIGDQYMNCDISGTSVRLANRELADEFNAGDMFMIKDESCEGIVFKVLYANNMLGHTHIDFDPTPPLDLPAGFTIARLVYTPELKIKNLKHIKSDSGTLRHKLYIKCGMVTPQIESFSNGAMSGWILYNERGDKCYVYPNSTGDGMTVTTVEP